MKQLPAAIDNIKAPIKMPRVIILFIMIVENVFNEQLMTRADRSLNGKIRKEGVNTLCLPI